jgi:hypothetical protein
MNRQQRRMSQSIHRKEVKQALSNDNWGAWEDITADFVLKMRDRSEVHRMKKYVKNNIYSAQVIDTDEGLLLGIRRHDQSTEVPWRHKQRIKNEVLGEVFQAIEVFPRQTELIDDANMYWLWVVHINVNLRAALRGIYGQ